MCAGAVACTCTVLALPLVAVVCVVSQSWESDDQLLAGFVDELIAYMKDTSAGSGTMSTKVIRQHMPCTIEYLMSTDPIVLLVCLLLLRAKLREKA